LTHYLAIAIMRPAGDRQVRGCETTEQSQGEPIE